MSEQRAAELRTIFSQVALKLQRALIDVTGTNYMEISISDRCNFDGPPLRAPAPLLEVDLDAIPACLYNRGVTRDHVIALWDHDFAKAIMKGDNQRVASRIRILLAGERLRGAAVERATQFLGIASLSSGCKVDFRSDRTLLWTDTARGRVAVGFDRGIVRWITSDGGQGQRSSPGAQRACGTDMLMTSIGNRTQSKPATGGVYRTLAAALPDLADQVHYVFSAAVAAGGEYEDLLTAPFDWVLNREAFDTIDDVWKQAAEIVQNATHSPLLELYRLLRVRVGYTAFYEGLGNPHDPSGEYRPSTRARHLRALAEMQRSPSSASSPATAVNELLQLQSLLGGSSNV